MFGDHSFLFRDGVIYDPSFAAKHTGTWKTYMQTILDQTFAVEKEHGENDKFIRCHAVTEPTKVIWLGVGDGDYRLRMIETYIGQDPLTYDLENPE